MIKDYRASTFSILTALTMVLTLLHPVYATAASSPVSASETVLALSKVNVHQMPRIENSSLVAEAERREASRIGVPYHFAHPFDVDLDINETGTWEILADGSTLWRLRVVSTSAKHINLGFSQFELPKGAELWIYNAGGDHVGGPYTNDNRSKKGTLFTPVIPGDDIVIEVHVPKGAQGSLAVKVGFVNHGFRSITKPFQGACNNDVICPEGDPWGDQISSVARFSIGGSTLCTGQLINNTSLDRTPYFLSADHCGVTTGNAHSVVVYWNYESPVCGDLSGGSLDQNQSGATFIASHFSSDTNLIVLDQEPLPEYGVDYGGWNVSDNIPQSSVSIHHPGGGEKAISFDEDPLTDADIGYGGNTHWEVGNWEDGTTEGGSSGSCLWDTSDGLCVGVLTGGFASCSVISSDFYGKLSIGWEGGGTPESRLRDWLDPLDSGATSLQGLNQLSNKQEDIPTINKFGLAAMVILLAIISVFYFRLRI